jgi:pyrimidine operon attenuation protein/uracil phosphoribosyltransferase
MKRLKVSADYAENIRQAEASSRLEGIDTSGDILGNQLKAKILAGEISVDQAIAIYLEDIQQEQSRTSFANSSTRTGC